MIKLGCNESLPFGWKWVEAGSVIDVRDGTHDSPKPVEKGIPLITSKNLKNGLIEFSTCSFISEEDHINIGKRSAVENGDILYAMIGTIGSPVIVNTTQAFSIKNVALFKFNKPDVYNRFFYHFLNSTLVKQQFDKNARGGTQKFVSLGNIRALQIPLPPLEEQKRIAAILDKADAIRQKRKQAIELADEFLRSVFLDMFGDPVTNPKGWEVKPLSELTTKITDGTHKTPSYIDLGVPFLSAKNIKPWGLDFEDTKFISREEHEQLIKRCNPELGDILLSKSGSLGTPAIVDTKNEFSLFESAALFKLNKAMIEPEFLYHFIRSEPAKYMLLKNTKGVAIKHLHLKELRELKIIYPPRELREDFIRVAEQVKRFVLKSSLSDIESVHCFHSLSQKAFSGQL
ncbi:restriction endonuclease subunit S [Aliivibrio fischeri]|uniref:Restriction endonuclease subunit S n=1 Tax=Aliivibrio fischeri TaxID=668 RepID=A0A844P408_ALIFS|nr:restriction endonuclease subunit S [Aliivibrio fischeri]MUK64467.1 restriction endonuclease subunit S [Aliivibrio fischeri]